MTDQAQRDFLAECQASTTGNPILEQIRDRGSDAVLALFRLVKNALVHAIDNRAVTTTAAQSREILSGFAGMVGSNASVTFLGDTIFVCGQLLRATRMVYESAVELGEIFARCGISEVVVEPDVAPEDLLELVRLVVAAYRQPEQRAALLEARIPHVSVRRVEAELQRKDTDDGLPDSERIVRFYATALVVMRGFFDAVAEGATVLPYRVKRLSQQLVTLAQTNDPALLGLTAMANAQRDDAGRSVLAAMLAVVIGKQITSDKLPLARLAMAALMADVGRVRVAGREGRDQLLSLAEADEARVPPATATVCLATGGVNVPSALRTVVTAEVTGLERESIVGPLYDRQRAPLVESQVLRLARALIDELAPRDAALSAKAPLDAIEAVSRLPAIDPGLLRVFINAVGLLPTGSVVEFETGEWGVVVGPSKAPEAFDRPIVRLVTDRAGKSLNPPREVDLGAPAPGSRVFPRIANVVPPKQARFNVTRVFLEA
ncbi:MAG: hypothetical protein FJ104_01295 [Deltaproteobacteria bacterium]|nr:hypothetical protein [Deltaproteobacteria bacterium]